jgi:hypothetical protein
MRIFYRVCPTLSDKPPAVDWDKYTMIQKCYNSLLEAGGDKYDIYIFNDRLPQKWIEELYPKYKKIIDAPEGNAESFAQQVEYASRHSGKVLLLEDDYLWRPDTLKHLDRALDELPFVSPYDHPSHYLEERFDKHFECVLIDGMVYREAPSNTLTFATTGEKLVEHKHIFDYCGILDDALFQGIAAVGDRIWNPTHSFATHLVDGLLAPNIDWQSLMI